MPAGNKKKKNLGNKWQKKLKKLKNKILKDKSIKYFLMGRDRIRITIYKSLKKMYNFIHEIKA